MPRKTFECLHCRENGNTEFHEIFDEVGVELQLDALLEQHFQLKVLRSPLEKQVLCDKCVNELIELFDIAERIKEHRQNETEGRLKEELMDPADDAQEVTLTNNDADETLLNSPEDVNIHGTEIPADELEEFIESEENGHILDYESLAFEIESEDVSPISEGEGNAKSAEVEDETQEDSARNIIEFDVVDLQAYAEATINTNLEELQLERDSECNICSEKLQYHQDLLIHIKQQHQDDNGFYPCVLENCLQSFENERNLATHIVLKHYDLRSISIFGSCPDCGITYSNFLDFNKHSCCTTLKCKGKTLNFCMECKMEFPTFRRYRFHMQFHNAKRRPMICLLCDRTFSNGEQFFEHVHYGHEPKDRLICYKCDRVCKNKKLFEAHIATHNIAQKFKCDYCHKSYTQKHLLKSHVESYHAEEDKFKCEFCNKVLANKANYRNHMKFHEPDAEVQVNLCPICGLIGREKEDLQEHVEDRDSRCFEATIEQKFLSVVYVCEYCEATFETKAHLKDHRATGIHLDNKFHCPLCAATFDEFRKVRAHLKSHKFYAEWKKSFPLYRMYMCNIGDCEQSYAMWVSFHTHKAMKHKELQLICAKCNQKFATSVDFDTHSKKCTKNGKFYCQFCEKECPSKMSLSVHIARSHNNKNVRCPTCKASFKDEGTLEKHIDFVHVRIECSLCHKQIKNKRNLLLHERIKHANVKRFFCNSCEKGFYNKSDMEVHERTAHALISYKCDRCPFTTNYKNSLDVHVAKHNNDFQYKCPLCPRQFTRKSVMEIHLKRHQVKREFVCSELIVNGCDASFITRYLLNKHVNEKHANLDGEQAGPPIKRRRKKSTRIEPSIGNAVDADDPECVGASTEDESQIYICYENSFILEENSSQDLS